LPKVSELLEVDPFNDVPLSPNEIHLLVNREEAKERLDALVRAASKGFPQHVAILGEDGSGKTSILNYVAAKARLHEGVYTAQVDITEGTDFIQMIGAIVRDLLNQVHVGLGSTFLGLFRFGREATRKEILQRLSGVEISRSRRVQLAEALFSIISYSSSVEMKKGTPEAVMEIMEILRQVYDLLGSSPMAIMILLDEGQYVASSRTVALLQHMRLLFQRKPYMLLVAGSPNLFSLFAQVEPSFNNLFAEQNRLRLTPLGFVHVRELVEKRLSLVRIRGLGIEPFTEEAVDRLYRLAEGNPRYVVRIASAALYLARNRSAVAPEVVEAAGQQILKEMGRDRFDRLKEDERELILTLARYGPLSITELWERLPRKQDLSTVSRKVRALADRGYVELTPRGKRKICHLRRALYAYVRDLV
jgi:Cdc6-like AAA superfamily ATPase